MIGKKLSHYEIVEKIGEGGMGEVYRDRDGVVAVQNWVSEFQID